MIDSSVRDGWRVWSAQFEGEIPYMYLDTHHPPLVTCAVGNLIDPIGTALGLPWLHADGSAADRYAIVAEWQRVKGMPGGLIYTRYHSQSGLHLDNEGIGSLVLARLDDDARILTQTFQEFPTFPPQAQKALLSMAWAMGAGFPSTWPRLSAAVRAQDWTACAANCEIRWQGNPGVRPRDIADRDLFLAASVAQG